MGLLENAKFVDVLTANSDVVVHKCAFSDGKTVITKGYNKCDVTRAPYQQELRVLTKIKSRHIINLLETVETDDKYILILEDGGSSLFDLASSGHTFSERRIRAIARGVCKALKVLHQHHIVHGDIKLENIVVKRHHHAKLIDFGLSETVFEESSTNEYCGSTFYRAPELILGKPHGAKVDVWALGITLSALAMHHFPFSSDNEYMNAMDVIAEQPDLEDMKKQYSEVFVDLVKQILEKDPSKRLSIKEILRHPWFRQKP